MENKKIEENRARRMLGLFKTTNLPERHNARFREALTWASTLFLPFVSC